jgi:hypothetical protein
MHPSPSHIPLISTYPIIHSPLSLVCITFALQLLLARFARLLLARLLSHSHHYHSLTDDKKRSIHTQIGMFAPRIPLLFYWIPVLRIYIGGEHERWEDYHSQLMDGMRYVTVTYLLLPQIYDLE